MLGRSPFLFCALFLAGTTLACQPRIGDDCNRNLDCSRTGKTYCDLTQLDGYCTQANCTPTSCPEGQGVCVAFGSSPSSVEGCGNIGRPSPYVRNFCMKNCEKASDCRDGYDCVDLSKTNDWGAAVIQENPESYKICISSQGGTDIPADRNNGVCVDVSGGAGASGSADASGSAGASGSN